MKREHSQSGFTLIELSIVLVIIGLIVGGILVGRDLISAAQVRAQITQIEKFNSAVNTFRGKYNNDLPGDINATDASLFGFAARGQYAGEGDGNGIIQGIDNNGPGDNQGEDIGAGETAMFWVDLSAAKLIDGTFNTAQANVMPSMSVPQTGIGAYMPSTKIGRGNYVYVYSGGLLASQNSTGINYFGLSAVTGITLSCCGRAVGNANIPVREAYNIDVKIDDGQPQSGRVTAVYLGGPVTIGDPNWTDGTDSLYSPPSTVATTANSSTCMDNGGVAGAKAYSLTYNGGSEPNCALSFQFQ